MNTDPIADMLTRIRNAALARKERVEIPFSKLKFNIANILKKENYISDVNEKGDSAKKDIIISLRYEQGKPAINKLNRISKPSRRVYGKKDELPFILNDYGIAIVSTPAGLMTNKEARKKGLGGEIICEIY